MRPSEAFGRAAGLLLAPITGTLSLVRRARMFHPEGAVYRARIEALPGRFELLARRIEGPALARLSTAWWRGGKEWMDVLGIALRIGRDPGVVPQAGDQDLLFATIQHPWTMPLAPLTTEQHDFLANDYFAVSPFEVTTAGRCKLRLVASRPRRLHARERGERLDEAAARGEAWLRLELRTAEDPWAQVALIRLEERMQVDQAALRFSPFRDGKGFSPRGFVNGMRRAAYAASQAARPSHAT